MRFKKIPITFLMILWMIFMILPMGSSNAAEETTNVSKQILIETDSTKILKVEKTAPTLEAKDIFEDITAPNLVLAETNSERIFYERKADEKIYPASITKLMTAILVVENCELEDKVTVSQNAVQSVPYGYVNANLKVGEELTVKDLLYALLLPSANDAANALAEHVGGSIEDFAMMMNNKAKELGCTNTHFTNPSGLHEKEHYTTAKDLLYIARKAVSNTTIRKIVGTTTYTLPKTNKYSKTNRILTTTNYMKRKELKRYYCDYCIGGKTGYTGQAKNCVVEFIQKDGIELTAIVMGENAKIKGKKFLDAKEMVDYIFANYKRDHVAVANKTLETITIPNGTKETRNLEVAFKEDIYILRKKSDQNSIQETIESHVEYSKRKAPIQKGEVIGRITYQYDGIEYTSELKAQSNVEESKFLTKLVMILTIALIIVVIIQILKKSKSDDLKKLNKSYKRKKAKRIHY